MTRKRSPNGGKGSRPIIGSATPAAPVYGSYVDQFTVSWRPNPRGDGWAPICTVAVNVTDLQRDDGQKLAKEIGRRCWEDVILKMFSELAPRPRKRKPRV